jgi:hypothetical protein
LPIKIRTSDFIKEGKDNLKHIIIVRMKEAMLISLMPVEKMGGTPD